MNDTGGVLMYSKAKRSGVCWRDEHKSGHRCRTCGGHTLSSYEPSKHMWIRRCMGACEETVAKTFEEL